MQNIMLDLETMGNSPTAAIVAIGAVAFDLDNHVIGKTWYSRVNLESAMQHGGTIDASTVTWWLQQSDDARGEIAQTCPISLPGALRNLSIWFDENTSTDVAVWGNGASFDNVILRGAYQRCGFPTPWSWWNDRCYRTVKAQHPSVPMERIGTHHNALADACSQARHLMAIYAARGAA